MIGIDVTDYLASMAVMKINYDSRGHDVLQMLVPFVADCARRHSQPLSDVEIQGELQETFGLPVPRTVVKTLLRRLTRSGALVREHGVFMPVGAELNKPEYDLSTSLADVQRGQAILLGEGVRYVLRVFNREVSEDDLSRALLVISRREIVPLAVWAVRGESITLDDSIGEELERIAAQYILYVISEGSSEAKAALEKLAKGSLLSGVLWSTDLEMPDRKIDSLEFFLDTTLLLRLLGLCGEPRRLFSQELTQLAGQSGIKLYCFEHNRRELVGCSWNLANWPLKLLRRSG